MPVLQQSMRFCLVGRLGAMLLQALHATWRIESQAAPGVLEGIETGSAPAVVAFWHRHILSMLGHFPGRRVAVPVSEHRDGEYAAQVMHRLGIASVRGSSTHGGLKLLRGMMAMIEAGYSPAVTPDGPRGPKFSVQPGVWLIAQRSALPVHPIGLAVRDAWTAASWDEFVIPKPFTRIVIRLGEPLHAREFAGRDDFCAALREALFATTASARRTLFPPERP